MQNQSRSPLEDKLNRTRVSQMPTNPRQEPQRDMILLFGEDSPTGNNNYHSQETSRGNYNHYETATRSKQGYNPQNQMRVGEEMTGAPTSNKPKRLKGKAKKESNLQDIPTQNNDQEHRGSKTSKKEKRRNPKEPKQLKDKGPHKKTKKVNKREQALKNESENTVKNYKVLRQELISGYMRIEELDLVGKIKLALRYKAEKSGKAEERRKREEMKRVRLENSKYNALMKSLQELTKPILEDKSLERSIKLDKAYESVLNKVINNSDFRGLRFETPPQNENYSRYIKDFPILLVVRKEGDGSVI